LTTSKLLSMQNAENGSNNRKCAGILDRLHFLEINLKVISIQEQRKGKMIFMMKNINNFLMYSEVDHGMDKMQGM